MQGELSDTLGTTICSMHQGAHSKESCWDKLRLGHEDAPVWFHGFYSGVDDGKERRWSCTCSLVLDGSNRSMIIAPAKTRGTRKLWSTQARLHPAAVHH